MKGLRFTVALLLALIASESLHAQVVARTDKLHWWTSKLRDSQPSDAVAAVYRQESRTLVFIAAKHSTDPRSLTFRLIDDAYASFRFDTLIVEGPLRSSGANNPKLLEWAAAQHETNGVLEGGEPLVAIRGARSHSISVLGGEPDDNEIKSSLLSKGISNEDLLGFYTLRSIPQWILQQRISGPGDAKVWPLIDDELNYNRTRLQLSSTVLPNRDAWLRWYRDTNGKAFGNTFKDEVVGPLADGKFRTNTIGANIERVRDAFLIETIAQQWNLRQDIIVVFGESHYMRDRAALDEMFGPPCYVGTDIKLAVTKCSSAK